MVVFYNFSYIDCTIISENYGFRTKADLLLQFGGKKHCSNRSLAGYGLCGVCTQFDDLNATIQTPMILNTAAAQKR